MLHGILQGNQTGPGTEQTFAMATTYYDTLSGAFSARKCTLRRRMENDLRSVFCEQICKASFIPYRADLDA